MCLRDIAVIQPDPTKIVITVEGKVAYLVVVHTLPKGRKYYPLVLSPLMPPSQMSAGNLDVWHEARSGNL